MVVAKTSVERLASLGYDPLTRMIKQLIKLEEEIETQEGIRDGRIKRLRQDGNERAYSPQFHMSLVQQAAALNEKILRFGYARVSETVQVEHKAPELKINLFSSNETFTLNPKDEQDGVDQSARDSE